MMQYVAVQVLTKKEAIVADIIEEQGRCHGVHLEVVAPGKSTSQYGEDGSRSMHVSELPGYVLVGFKKWENRIYHIIKGAFGVIRVLLGNRVTDGYSGIMTEKELNPSFLREEEEVAVEVTEDHHVMAERLKKHMQKCREFIEKKKNKTVRWIAVPFSVVSNVFDNTTPEFLNNEGGKAFRRIWERLSRLLRQNRRAM